MPGDAVSRTANVERNGGQKWVNASRRAVRLITAVFPARAGNVKFPRQLQHARAFKYKFVRCICVIYIIIASNLLYTFVYKIFIRGQLGITIQEFFFSKKIPYNICMWFILTVEMRQ